MIKVSSGKLVGLGLAAVALAAFGVLACSSDSSGGGTPGTGPGTGTGTGPGGTGPSTGTGTGPAGTGPSTGTGTGPAGTGPSTGTGTGTTPGSCTSSVIDGTGFFKAGVWQGYPFTMMDSETSCAGAVAVSPVCTSAGCTPAMTGEFKGTVGGCTDYGGFAGLGWNLNQPSTAGATIGTWAVPATGGVTVTFSDSGTGVKRLQLQKPNAATNDDRYCAPITSGVQVKWTDFKTYCWNDTTHPSVALAAGVLLAQASVNVVGTQSAVPYDVCVSSIVVQ